MSNRLTFSGMSNKGHENNLAYKFDFYHLFTIYSMTNTANKFKNEDKCKKYFFEVHRISFLKAFVRLTGPQVLLFQVNLKDINIHLHDSNTYQTIHFCSFITDLILNRN